MKEYDYSKWDNHPREMWVWDKDENKKKKLFVVFIDADSKDKTPVLSRNGVFYEHCAEIEQTRRMTNYELARWLWEGQQKGEFREYTFFTGNKKHICITRFDYFDEEKEKKVDKAIKIRVNGGEWKEPLIEE